MKKIIIICSGLACILAACNQQDRRDVNQNYDVDNTARNVRDRNFDTTTPGDQSESDIDRTITLKIRRAVMADGALSTDAKNIKIITINGIVTLRGVVNGDNERSAILSKVDSIDGVRRVENQIEVKRG